MKKSNLKWWISSTIFGIITLLLMVHHVPFKAKAYAYFLFAVCLTYIDPPPSRKKRHNYWIIDSVQPEKPRTLYHEVISILSFATFIVLSKHETIAMLMMITMYTGAILNERKKRHP